MGYLLLNVNECSTSVIAEILVHPVMLDVLLVLLTKVIASLLLLCLFLLDKSADR
eukprot:m.54063 g.54063  ORF g.54063 m.54063 type:complete len:55 (+) comp11386_c1_seq1:902-1066(+)